MPAKLPSEPASFINSLSSRAELAAALKGEEMAFETARAERSARADGDELLIAFSRSLSALPMSSVGTETVNGWLNGWLASTWRAAVTPSESCASGLGGRPKGKLELERPRRAESCTGEEAHRRRDESICAGEEALRSGESGEKASPNPLGAGTWGEMNWLG